MLLNEIKKREEEIRNLTQEKKQIQDIEKKEINTMYKNSNKKEIIKQELSGRIKDCDNKIKLLNDRIDFLQLLILQLQEIYNKNISKGILEMLIKNYEKIQKIPLRYKKNTKLLDNYKNCYLDKDYFYVNNFNKNTEVYFYISDSGYFEEKYICSLERLQDMYDKIVIINSLEQIKKIEIITQKTLDFENEIKKNIKELKDKNEKKRTELKNINLDYLQNHLYNNLQNEKRYL